MCFQVMKTRCGQCLFGPNKIVTNARRSQILRDLRAKNDYFVCHKGSIVGETIACRGDWDQNRCGQTGRLAERLNLVTFVEEPGR